MSHLWNIKLSSFAGLTLKAKHWYVKLESGYDTIYVERVLTKAAAAQLTEDDFSEYDCLAYQAGESTNRFQSKEDAITAGLMVWNSFKTPGDALISTGDKWNLPYRLHVPAGPPEFVKRTRALVLLGERELYASRIRDCDKAWEDLLAEFNLVEAREWEERSERTAHINRNKTVSLKKGVHPKWGA